MPSILIRIQNPQLHQAVKDLAHEKRKTLQALCVELLTDAVNKQPKARAVLHRKRKESRDDY